jgi:hypothetical protein
MPQRSFAAAKLLAELLFRRKTLLTSLRELDVSHNKIQVDGMLKLINRFVLHEDRPPVFPFTLNWAEQNHILDLASLRSQGDSVHGLIEVQERVFRVGGILGRRLRCARTADAEPLGRRLQCAIR